MMYTVSLAIVAMSTADVPKLSTGLPAASFGSSSCDMTGSIPPCSSTSMSVGKPCSHESQTLSPTQESLGMVLVACKTDNINGKSADKLDKYLRDHPVPVVIGPFGKLYITDHHHLSKAMSQSVHASTPVYICPTLDLSNTGGQFWSNMSARGLVWQQNNEGEPISGFSQIPKSINDMNLNDPYRTVSEWVRDDYGYIKCDCEGSTPGPTASFPQCKPDCDNPPFLEFIWGDVIRKTFPIDGIYSTSTSKEIAALLSIWPNATSAVKSSQYSSLPHYNSGTIKPPVPPVEVDPSSGCEVKN